MSITTPRLEEVRAVRRTRTTQALGDMIAAGVEVGAPVLPREGDCTFCEWHVTRDGVELDGASASVLCTNMLVLGYYGPAVGLVIHPVYRGDRE